MNTRTGMALVTMVISTGCLAGRALAQCLPEWDRSLGTPTFGVVQSSIVHDDGGGESLYFGGKFTQAPGSFVAGVTRLRGDQWEPLGEGLWRFTGYIFMPGIGNVPTFDVGSVNAMVKFDAFSTNPARTPLVVAGVFNIIGLSDSPPAELEGTISTATWSGEAGWQLMPGLLDNFGNSSRAGVQALVLYDVGGQTKLFAAGAFRVASSHTVGVAVWNGNTWDGVDGTGLGALGTGGNVTGTVGGMCTHNDGSGNALYVAGTFEGLRNFSTNTLVPGTGNIAKFDGTSWSSVSGSDFPAGIALLAEFDPDGAGGNPAYLYAIGGNLIYRWDGVAWSQLTTSGVYASMYAKSAVKVVQDDPLGPSMYFAYSFGSNAVQLKRFDGTSVTPFGDQLRLYDTSGLDAYISHIGSYVLNGQRELMVGGYFGGPIEAPYSGALRWNGSRWSEIAGVSTGGPTSHVWDIARFDPDGSGPQPETIAAAGKFLGTGDASVARKTSGGWAGLGASIPGLQGNIEKLHSYAGDLLALGATSDGQEQVQIDVFKYGRSTNTWDSIGKFSNSNSPNNTPMLRSLLSADIGDGEKLYVFGQFASVSGVPAASAAVWDGASWQQLGAFGVTHDLYTNIAENIEISASVAITAGPDRGVYIVGRALAKYFPDDDAYLTASMMRWDGSDWSIIQPTGLPTLPVGFRDGIYDSPLGQPFVLNNQLYIKPGSFNMIFKFNGQTWDQVVSDFGLPTTGINARYPKLIGVEDLGQGTRAIFTSTHTLNRTGSACSLYEFDGVSFTMSETFATSFIGNLPDRVVRLGAGENAETWFNGAFWGVNPAVGFDATSATAHGISAFSLARFACPGSACIADFNHANGVNVQDIFEFLAAWFAVDPSADVNHTQGVNVQDIFDFLTAWFNGCP